MPSLDLREHYNFIPVDVELCRFPLITKLNRDDLLQSEATTNSIIDMLLSYTNLRCIVHILPATATMPRQIVFSLP